MDEKTLNSFKLAGLRAGQITQAATQDSSLVRAAMRFNLLRKNTKLSLKRLFKGSPLPVSNPKLRFLVHIRGGIGDVCMGRILVKKLRETLPQAEISFTHDSQTIVNMVFSDGLIDRFEPFGYLPEQFDVVLSGCHLLMYDYVNLPRVKELAPHFVPILQKAQEIQACFKNFATYSPYLDGQLAEIAIAHGGSRVTNLGWFSGLEIAQNDEAPIQLDAQTTHQTLEKLGLLGHPYITIHDGINTRTDTSLGHPTRCWPETHWQAFARLFKTAFPAVKLVQKAMCLILLISPL